MDVRSLKSLGFFAVAFGLFFCFMMPAPALADEWEELDIVDWADEFDALWSIEDPKERERRATHLMAQLLADFAHDRGGNAAAGLILASVDELSENAGIVNAGGVAVTGSSVAASALSPDAPFSRSLGEVNNLLTDLGALLVTYDLFYSLYVDQSFKEDDMWGYVKSAMLYYINRFPANATMAAWAFNLAFVDYVLTKVIEETLTDYEESWYDAYQWFFLQGPGKMGMQEWADLFEPAWAMGEGEDYVTYLDSFWNNPERFRLPTGNPIATAEIFDYYFNEVEHKSPPTLYRSGLANAKLQESFRGRFVREHLVAGMRMILDHRREMFEGKILNDIRARQKRLIAEIRRLTERKDWTVTVVDSSTGQPVEGATVIWTTMWFDERGDFKTDASGNGTINAPAMTPKLNFRISKYRYRETEDFFYPDRDPGPTVLAHLDPLAAHGLTVQVTDRRTKKPIQNAKIDYWFEEKTAKGETDDQGYAWRDFPDGMYVVLAVEAPGYQGVSDWGVQLHEEPVFERIGLEPEAGAAVADLEVVVLAAGDGAPIPNASIHISSGNHREDGKSDATGRVVLSVVPDALTQLDVAATGYKSLSDSIRVGAEGSLTTVRLETGGAAPEPQALELALNEVGDVSLMKPLELRFSYSVPTGKKHDMGIKVLDPQGKEIAVEYRRDIVSQTGAESGVIRFDGPVEIGPHKARMAVIYGGKNYESPVLSFDAKYTGGLAVTVKSDTGEEGVLRQMVPGLAEINPAPDASIKVERVDWFMTLPEGRRVASRDNGTERTAGANGFVNDIRLTERAKLGKYGIEAQVVSAAGTLTARGQFELLPPEDVPSDSEFTSARVRWAGSLSSGVSTPLTIDGLPFEISELGEGDIRGLGNYKGGAFKIDQGLVFFRPKLSGRQTAMFALEYDGKDYPVKFDCDVDLTMIEARISEKGLDESKGTVELLFKTHRDFAPPFRIRRQTPRGALSMGGYQESMGALLLKGDLKLDVIERPPLIDVMDSEGAEARIDLKSVVSLLEFRDTRIALGARVLLELRGMELVGNVQRGGALVSPNIEVEYAGGTPKLYLETERDDKRRQYVWVALVGTRGIGVGGEWIDLEAAGEVAETVDSDCNPPSKVKAAIRRLKAFSGGENPMMGAINRRDMDEIQSKSQTYFDDSIMINNWAAGLSNCDMLTNEDRSFFRDMTGVLKTLKSFSDPSSIQNPEAFQKEMQELQRKMQGIQSRSRAVEQRTRRSGFYDLLYED